MDDKSDIEDVCKYLKVAGLVVSSVDVDPQSLVERCDLSATDACEKYLIEVKGINDEAEINQALRKGELYEADRSHVYRKRVAKEIHKATSQLQSTASEYDDHLWLAALIAKSKYDPRFMSEQILGTLYGVAAITDIDASDVSRRRRCLYFSESAFHKHPELDGAMVLSPDGVALYMNDYGRRFDRVRRSGLACFFDQHNALYDKETMETRSDCLVADFDMDRANTDAVLDRIRQKYHHRRLQFVNWHRWEGIA